MIEELIDKTEDWNELDLGKIIDFRDEDGLDNRVAIYYANPLVPNTLGVVEYPIDFNSKIVIRVGVPKNQEVKEISDLKKTGDWCFIKTASKDEKEELERIAKASKNPINEDLRPSNMFNSYPQKEMFYSPGI